MGSPAPEWLRTFGALHDCAPRGELRGPDLQKYRDGREVLARVLLAAQQVALPRGQQARRSLRAARALHVDVACGGQAERAPTLDVSAGGVAAWLAMSLKPGDEVDLSVQLPKGADLRARARVVSVRRHEASARASVGFQFLSLRPADVERLEMFVFDAVLEHLA